jgi:hypothetical protein
MNDARVRHFTDNNLQDMHVIHCWAKNQGIDCNYCDSSGRGGLQVTMKRTLMFSSESGGVFDI